MRFTPAVLLPALALATPEVALEERQSGGCAKVHIFGARETTAPAGYGTSAAIVNAIKSAYSGATSEAISYPACGGQSSCGGTSYANSAQQGEAAVATAVNAYVAKCPDSEIALIGYSQGAQIFDWAYCGNSAPALNAAAIKAVKVVILMGTPTNTAGLPYNVGTCTNHGFAARASGYKCSSDSSIIKSYCDSTANESKYPYCCNGNDANSHQQYASKYQSQIMAFVKEKLSAS